MRKKKICLIAPSLQMGGIERAMSTLANHFSDRNHEVYFITILALTPFFKLNDNVHYIVPPYHFERKKNLFKYIKYYINIFFPFKGYLSQTIKTINPDTIMCFGDIFPQLCMISLLGIKVPFYLSNRSSPQISYKYYIEIIRKIVYVIKKPTGVIAQTIAAYERKRRILGEKANIKVIPNPVRKIHIYDIEKNNWIVSIGRLHHEKGFDRLIEAFALVDAPTWKLVIAGTGKHEKPIKQKSIDMGISDRVIFLGKVDNIDQLLSQSKIFVLPSYGEGFPNALCEAMVAGVPSISFNIIAGPSDIIEDGINGYLITDGDIEGMSKKIQYLINNKSERERIGTNSKAIVDKYSVEKIGDQYLEFILQYANDTR
jgi:GalNAc-alpha-(1->4)-GalNAc-alpha-(1->3)-diNAcBac-PP-undecaprenol alpha-1,4-N-acetyl-D-galactosaminyltransferase